VSGPKTWFVVDFLATLPVEYIARHLQGTANCSWNIKTYPCPASAFKTLTPTLKQCLDLLRSLRLLKLLRVTRAMRIFERYQEMLGNYHAALTMMKLLVFLLFMVGRCERVESAWSPGFSA